MTAVCRWINDPEIGPWHLPAFWGAVNAGPESSYCDGPEDGRLDFDRLAIVEAKLDELIARLEP
jgi:hypothetical protein